MYKPLSEVGKSPEHTKASKPVIPEYKVIMENIALYQRLFQYRYLENVATLSTLQELLGCRDVEEVVAAERNLDAYFRWAMGGTVRSDLLGLVCPNCFQLTLTNYGKNGESIRKTCSECGAEAPDLTIDVDDFTQNLDRDVSFAPESKISDHRGLGQSFNPRKHREHNGYLWGLLNSRNILYSNFKKSFPKIAKALNSSYLVESHGFVFCHVGDFVRRVSIDEFFDYVNSFFHSFDVPLKNKKVRLAINVKSKLKRALRYGLQLCERYGFDKTDKDQALYNTVGNEIRLMKHQLKVQKRSVPEKRLVETIFYICLFQSGERLAAGKAINELDIDFDLVNYYVDYKEFLRTHEKMNGSKKPIVSFDKTLKEETTS